MSLEQNKQLTNPFAEESNVVKVRIAETGDCTPIPLVLDLDIDGALLLDMSNQLTDTTLYNYINVTVTDGSNELSTVWNATTNAFPSLDLSTFDVSKDWVVDVAYAPSAVVGVDCPCHKSFKYVVKGTKANFTKTFDASQAVAVLSVKVNGNAVADGGTETLAAASVGDTIIVPVVLSNTGVANLTIQSVQLSGDGEASGYFYQYGALEGANEFTFLNLEMDTATVGTKTATITIATDEAANPIYTLDVEVTVS